MQQLPPRGLSSRICGFPATVPVIGTDSNKPPAAYESSAVFGSQAIRDEPAGGPGPLRPPTLVKHDTRDAGAKTIASRATRLGIALATVATVASGLIAAPAQALEALDVSHTSGIYEISRTRGALIFDYDPDKEIFWVDRAPSSQPPDPLTKEH